MAAGHIRSLTRCLTEQTRKKKFRLWGLPSNGWGVPGFEPIGEMPLADRCGGMGDPPPLKPVRGATRANGF